LTPALFTTLILLGPARRARLVGLLTTLTWRTPSAAAEASVASTRPRAPGELDLISRTVWVGCQAAVVGVALGLLDDWLPGHDPRTPSSLAVSTRLPAGHWVGERAAVDVLAVALSQAPSVSARWTR